MHVNHFQVVMQVFLFLYFFLETLFLFRALITIRNIQFNGRINYNDSLKSITNIKIDVTDNNNTRKQQSSVYGLS